MTMPRYHHALNMHQKAEAIPSMYDVNMVRQQVALIYHNAALLVVSGGAGMTMLHVDMSV